MASPRAASTSTPSCAARAPTGPTCLVERGRLGELRDQRYAGWSGALGSAILDGSETLASLEDKVAAGAIDPRPVSGHQELLENVVNESIWAADH